MASGWIGLLACAAASWSLPACAAPSPWANDAVRDLAAMHDIVRDNHPGPVDAQNPGFRTWLDGGAAELRPQAHAARTLHDYQLVLRTYANGFADGHLGIVLNDAEAHLWPGFLVRADAPGAPLHVSTLAAGPAAPRGLTMGAVLVSCGGVPADHLLRNIVMRPALNPHVPQRMRLASAALMVADADDPADQWPDCVVASRGTQKTVTLHWRPIAEPALAQAKIASGGIDIPATGLRRIGDVWLISMPRFYPRTKADTASLQHLVASVKADAASLHAARHVVLDMRGNDGGDSDWGFEVAEALWGQAAVDAVGRTLSAIVLWRVSSRNDAALRHDAAMLGQQGQADAAAYFGALASRMERALTQHDVFMREPGDAALPMPRLTSPFAHPVYLLTTPHCASACLDFVDLMNGLPGVVRIGLETSSDTDYLEVAEAKLPSGHATLHYAMKVYRARKRGANVSYRPAIAWPGGDMDDAAIVKWIDGLP